MTKEEKREKFLEEKGFKRDKYMGGSSFWWYKPIKIEDVYKAELYYDGRYCHIDVVTFMQISGNVYEKNLSTIWKGDWKQFLNKIKYYDRY